MERVVYLKGKNFKGAEIFARGTRGTVRTFKINSTNTAIIFTDILQWLNAAHGTNHWKSHFGMLPHIGLATRRCCQYWKDWKAHLQAVPGGQESVSQPEHGGLLGLLDIARS